MSFVEKPPYFGCPSGKIGLLSSMFTSPDYRRMGIAKELLHRVIEEAGKYGCGTIQITASDMGVKLYAAFMNQVDSTRIDSCDFRFQEGDFAYHDTYVGGEQFAGEEAVWKNGKAVYAMNYLGRVLGENFSGNFLKEALRAATIECPYRGPEFYQSGEYIYKSKVSGDFTWFQGYEEIYCNEEKVYECYFHGGLMH